MAMIKTRQVDQTVGARNMSIARVCVLQTSIPYSNHQRKASTRVNTAVHESTAIAAIKIVIAGQRQRESNLRDARSSVSPRSHHQSRAIGKIKRSY
jgi:hypothetical protein